jgi:hypothetical protein
MAVEDGGRRGGEKAQKARYFNSHAIGRYREGREATLGALAPIAALAANPTQTTQDQ